MTETSPSQALRIVVLPGDGIGPEITAATRRGAAGGRRACRLGFAFETVTIGFAALRRTARRFPTRRSRQRRRADGVILGPVSHNDYPPAEQGRHQSVRRAAQAARPVRQHPPGALARRLPAALRQAGRSRHRAREHRRLLRRPQHVRGHRRIHADAGPRAGGAQDHARKARRASPRTRSGSRCSGARRSPPCTRRTCCASPTGCFSNACARSRRAIPQVDYEEKIIDAMAALLVRDASAFDVDRHHQHVRRHPVRRGLRDRRQPRPRRLAQCRHRARAWRRRSTARRPTSPARTSANPASLIGSAAMLLAWLGERRGDDAPDRAPRTRSRRRSTA